MTFLMFHVYRQNYFFRRNNLSDVIRSEYYRNIDQYSKDTLISKQREASLMTIKRIIDQNTKNGTDMKVKTLNTKK